jgi:replication initiator protein
MAKQPSAPRQAGEHGYDPKAIRDRRLRERLTPVEETADDQGGLRRRAEAAGLPKISVIKKRLIDASTEIRQGDPDELTFMHTVLTQCALPAGKPQPDMLTWERRQGRAALLIEAGRVRHPTSGDWQQLGLPYGPKARLLLMHLNSEALRHGSPIIPVEDTMTAFFRRLMGKTQDGRQANMLKAQLSALAAATFRMSVVYDDQHSVQVDAKVVSKFELWLTRDESQRVLWPSTLQLSLDYYDSLTRYAVPLDERAVAALAKSATALDVYCWLAQRLHRVPAERPQFVPWAALQEQFGQGYAEIRQFRAFFLRMLKQVKAVYQGARFDADRKGMCLLQSPPPVRKRLTGLDTRFLELTAQKP